jgi:hypothetical protein
MKKINLKGISEVLTEKELKNVMGGSGDDACYVQCYGADSVTVESWSTSRCPDSNQCDPGLYMSCTC